MEPARRLLRPLLRTALHAIPPVRKLWTRLGRRAELSFWHSRPDLIGDGERQWNYTELFGIERDWYRGKRMLDVGCGPRGSLDWAAEADARVGLDPLADEYRDQLGVDTSAMDYVKGVAEAMPFDDASFDVVGSFNSLDHVEDVDKVADEIARVIRPGGLFLLGTDVAHRPRLMEPHTFGWDLTRRFEAWFDVIDERQLKDTGHFDKSLHDAVPREGSGPGVLVAKLKRR